MRIESYAQAERMWTRRKRVRGPLKGKAKLGRCLELERRGGDIWLEGGGNQFWVWHLDNHLTICPMASSPHWVQIINHHSPFRIDYHTLLLPMPKEKDILRRGRHINGIRYEPWTKLPSNACLTINTAHWFVTPKETWRQVWTPPALAPLLPTELPQVNPAPTLNYRFIVGPLEDVESETLQRIAFHCGYKWAGGGTEIVTERRKFLCFRTGLKSISYSVESPDEWDAYREFEVVSWVEAIRRLGNVPESLWDKVLQPNGEVLDNDSVVVVTCGDEWPVGSVVQINNLCDVMGHAYCEPNAQRFIWDHGVPIEWLRPLAHKANCKRRVDPAILRLIQNTPSNPMLRGMLRAKYNVILPRDCGATESVIEFLKSRPEFENIAL